METITQIDISILNFIQQFRTGFGDIFFPFITRFGDAGIFWMVLTLILLIIPKTRKYGLAMAVSLAIEAILCNVIIKPLVNRTRPFDYVDTVVNLIVKAPTDPSFPSGHTGASFACASALLFTKSKLWIPAAILATLIAFSRLYLYVHYPSDVLVGAVIGTITGILGTLVMKSVYEAISERNKRKLAK